MYETYNAENACTRDKIAWALCQIIDDDAPLRWARYRTVAGCIAMNPEVMTAAPIMYAELKEAVECLDGGGQLSYKWLEGVKRALVMAENGVD